MSEIQRIIQVGVFSANSRDLSMIGIILKHIKPAGCTFSVAPDPTGDDVRIAIVDATDTHMRDELAAVLRGRPQLPAIYLVDAPGESGARFEIHRAKIALHLLQRLQRVVQANSGITAADSGLPAAQALNSGNVVALSAPRQLMRLRALVVDDSPTVRLQLTSVVRRIGMQCDSAKTGREALALVAEKHYDVAYVDVVMPEMDGYKLTRAIRREPSGKNTPVIILTSRSSPFDRARGALAGCDTFLSKPVDLKQFYEATAKVLRKTLAVDNLDAWIRDPTITGIELGAAHPPAKRALLPS